MVGYHNFQDRPIVYPVHNGKTSENGVKTIYSRICFRSAFRYITPYAYIPIFASRMPNFPIVAVTAPNTPNKASHEMGPTTYKTPVGVRALHHFIPN